MRYPVAVCVFCLLLGTVLGPVAAHDPYGPPADPATDVEITYELSLLPTEPGVIGVTSRVSLPERVTRFELTPPRGAVVTSARGFDVGGSRGSYRWDGATAEPRLRYRSRINGSALATERTAAVSEWGLLRLYTPRVTPYWWASEPQPGYGTDYRLAEGEAGVTSRSLAALGEHRQLRRPLGNATIRLVVPAGVEPAADLGAVLDSLAFARRELAVGHRHETVTGFVVPARLQAGGFVPNRGVADFAVNAEEPVRAPSNVWVHEYVHTRQDFRTGPETDWLVEASAEYYAALVTLQHGTATWSAFEAAVQPAAFERVDLSRSDDRHAHYEKGAAAVAAIDARIREATDGARSFDAVFRRLNGFDGELAERDLKAILKDVAGESLNGTVEHVVRGTVETVDLAPPEYYGVSAEGPGKAGGLSIERTTGTPSGHGSGSNTGSAGSGATQSDGRASVSNSSSNGSSRLTPTDARKTIPPARTPGAAGRCTFLLVVASVGVLWALIAVGRGD